MVLVKFMEFLDDEVVDGELSLVFEFIILKCVDFVNFGFIRFVEEFFKYLGLFVKIYEMLEIC